MEPANSADLAPRIGEIQSQATNRLIRSDFAMRSVGSPQA